MALYLVGLGLGSEQGLTLAGLEAAKRCGVVYLETYTSVTPSRPALEKLIGKPVKPANRTLVEQDAEHTVLADAKAGDACLLVPGDPFAATGTVRFAVLDGTGAVVGTPLDLDLTALGATTVDGVALAINEGDGVVAASVA